MMDCSPSLATVAVTAVPVPVPVARVTPNYSRPDWQRETG